MKKLHLHLNCSLNWMVTTLLGVLGFSCTSYDEPENLVCMYGTPTAYYTIKGKVMDTTGQALPNIQVVVSDLEFGYAPRPGFIPDHPTGTYPLNDTLYTEENGEFIFRQSYSPMDTVRYKLKINPSRNNPLYEADSLKVTFIRKDLQGGEGWNCGNAEKEIKVTLISKKEEENE